MNIFFYLVLGTIQDRLSGNWPTENASSSWSTTTTAPWRIAISAGEKNAYDPLCRLSRTKRIRVTCEIASSKTREPWTEPRLPRVSSWRNWATVNRYLWTSGSGLTTRNWGECVARRRNRGSNRRRRRTIRMSGWISMSKINNFRYYFFRCYTLYTIR